MDAREHKTSSEQAQSEVVERDWLYPRRFYMPDSLLQQLQELVDSPSFRPRAFNAAEDFKVAGFGASMRLAQKWRHWSMDSETLREIVFYPDLSLPGRRAPMVSEQVLAALQILSSGPTSHDSEAIIGVTDQAQRVLSRLLVRYPVLMHPLMRFPMEDGAFNQPGKNKSPIVSVAQAICVTARGRFPLTEDGITDEELNAFYRHTCVRVGLFEPPISGHGKVDPERAILWQSCADALVEDHKTLMPGLFASLYQAHKAFGDRAPDLRFSRAFEPDSFCAGRFAEAFQRSCKLRSGKEHPAAIAALREIGAGPNVIFGAIVAKEMVGDLFSEILHDINDTEYEVRVRDAVQKIREVGIAADANGACEFLLQALASYRNDASFKAALPRHALAFLQVLVDEGQVKINPEAFAQPQWKVAAHAVANATTMRETIQTALHAANDSAPTPLRRPARMGI